MTAILRLMIEFFKTGLFSVGGGLATLPFLYEMSDKTGWFSHADIADMIAISESTPGAIGINMSTYAGYKTAGVPGGILATLALAAPSVIIILIIAAFLKSFRDNRYVNDAFYGLRPASAGLIASAGIGVAVSNFFITEPGWSSWTVNFKGLALFALLWVLTNKVKKIKDLHPIVFILGSAVVGILFQM